MGFFSKLFGKEEPAQEPVIEAELKENKDLLWERMSSVLSYVENDLRPELIRAQQKKWMRATFSDFRNFHAKMMEGRMRLEKEIAKIEAVPLQNPVFQEYSRNMVSSFRRLTEEIKMVEQQLQGERNVTEVTNHVIEGINVFDEMKGYWTSQVRKQFLD